MPKQKQKKPGCLVKLLAIVLLGSLAVWGIKSCGDVLSTPETPEQAEKKQQDETAKAEKWKQEEAKQPERKELIQKLINQGVFRKVEFRDRVATIWVDSSFSLLDFDAKSDFCSVVYAYVAANAKDELVSVRLKDAQSGKTIGDYGQQWTGFGLKMK